MNRWDDWVAQDRVMKFTEENKLLAAQLHSQMKALQQKGPSKFEKKKGSRANASDNSSMRGSEERHASVAAQPHRNKRTAREYELEPVSDLSVFLFPLPWIAAFLDLWPLDVTVRSLFGCR